MQTQAQQTEPLSIPAGDRGKGTIFTIPSERIGEFWPLVAPFLMMVENPDWTLDEVFECICEKQAQVWAVSESGSLRGIWITQIKNTQKNRYGLVWIAAGAATNTLDLGQGINLFLEHTESWFKELGCKEVRIIGRKGWVKALPGFKYHSAIMSKTL